MYADSTTPKIVAPGARSFDLCASLNRPERLAPGAIKAIPTGIAMDIPEGYGLYIASRPGLAKRHEVFVLSSTGLVECNFPDELTVILKNSGTEPFFVNPGAKIAHAWVTEVSSVNFKEIHDE